MYIKRWLEIPSQSADGTLHPKEGKGTPQGGVISPLLSNLYLHYVLDKWIKIHYPQVTFVRYADDVIVHCNNEEEANRVLEAIRKRLQECKLRLNEEKTKLVYCKDYKRKEKNDYKKKFDFLGFTFKPHSTLNKRGLYLVFDCAISLSSQTRIITSWQKENFQRRRQLTIQEIAMQINPKMIGIIHYYGKYKRWLLNRLIRHFHYMLAKWAFNKYKGLKRSYSKAYRWIKAIKTDYPNMFYHWTIFKNV